ncbi:BCCT family transporter [Oceanobacillus timonensis]|uniref:BCCT family transporter n=1 Tax=Oceanobacillus timonensis TaxID=1926285 RepID=UPI0009B94C37|nr:BCCT family transporter [Oceanobacillus timonensis]
MRKNIVVIVSLIVTFIFVVLGIFVPNTLGQISEYVLYTFISENFGWYYMLVAFSFVSICLYVAFSKYGKIRLGKDTDKPEFSRFTWIAMLYSSGLAISLFFWGVAEPVLMYIEPPFGSGQTKESAETAMRYTFFHWGLHSWGTYTIIGLLMAYFQYRKNNPPLINHALYPLLGEKIYGWIGKFINIVAIFAIFAIISGITTSLGLGATQIGAGFDYVLGINNSPLNQTILILSLTVMFIISASTGIQRGIKWLSNINIIIALAIMMLIFVLGPTRNIMETFVNSTGDYIENFIGMSFHLEPFLNDYTWQGGWDFFYWGWAISFGVFVGIFIARISKGRTIREFIIGAMLIPTLATTIWYSTFGGSALYNIINLGNNELSNQIMENMDTALFYFLELFPFSSIIIGMTFVSLIIFFVTSADSTVYVLGMYSEETMEPSNKSKILWGIVIAGVAIALLFSGGLTPLQTISAAAGLPFSLIILAMCFSFFKSLKEEKLEGNHKEQENNMSSDSVSKDTESEEKISKSS